MTNEELEQIYNEAYRAVYWTAMSLLKNEADAEDIVQDTFVAFIESYADIKDTRKATALLKKIAANKCFDRIKLARTDNVEDEFFENAEAVPEDFLPDTIIESAEMRKIVIDIINNSLSEDIRRTLILFYFDEMSTKEIAETLGIPQGTVLWRLNFAKKKIKKEVEKYEEDNDTKLFGMAIPFLTKLFIKESEQVVFKPMPASLANLSASVKASGKGVNIKASKGALRKGTDIMKTKILIGGIAAVVALGVTVGIIAGVASKKKDTKPDMTGVESGVGNFEESETTKSALKADKDLFVWHDNEIIELTEAGCKVDVLVIPAECEGFHGSILNEGVYTEVYFESDDDIDIGMAFAENANLKKIVLPKNLTSLGIFAFSNCTGLESIEIPKSVTKLDAGAFMGCSSLKNIEIPEGITELSGNLFFECKNLEEVKIDGAVTSIGTYCFNKCESLKSIELPSSLKTLEGYAFAGCKSLTSIELPEGLEKIDTSAFKDCSSMTSLKVPSSVKEVGLILFVYSGIEDVYLPAGLELTESDPFSFSNPYKIVRILPIQDVFFGRVL